MTKNDKKLQEDQKRFKTTGLLPTHLQSLINKETAKGAWIDITPKGYGPA